MSEAASEPEKPVEKKKGKGKLVGILVALALILGAGAAGAVLAPKYLGGAKDAKAGAHAEGEEAADGESEEHGEEAAESEEAKEEPAEDSGHKKPAAGEVHEVQNFEP